MKCHICGNEIPEGKKYCPGCGRVVRLNTQQSPAVSSDTMKFDKSVTEKLRTELPPSQDKKTTTDKTINIPDIFSTDPNAPEYTDPHAYDTATAHVLEYDRMFVSRNEEKDNGKQPAKAYTDDRTKQFTPVSAPVNKRIVIEQEPSDDYYDDNEVYQEQEASEADKKAGPHINVKAIIIIVAVILGIVLSVKGVYEIGMSFGFWGTENTSSNVSEDDTDKDKLPANKEQDSDKDDKNNDKDEDEIDYKTGIYTVKSEYKNIFVYKSATDRRITATIPRGAILEITEIQDGLGKTTYNAFTGWVEMTDLNYTPDSVPDNKDPETTTKAEETSVKKDDEDEAEETPDAPTTPGTYTVTLTGSSPLNVRDNHSPDGEIISTLKNGTTVEVIEVKSGWGKITLDGQEGWVYMQYLK
ncbi:MAG: SH3 domain-containing protein [Clostridia bacterium]|nr:SH3 domain-containing protein [Clostridia bacterium]